MFRIVIVMVTVLFTLVGCGSEEPSYEEDPAIAALERQFRDCEADENFDASAYYKENRMVYFDGEHVSVDRFSEGHYDHRGVYWTRTVQGDCVFSTWR